MSIGNENPDQRHVAVQLLTTICEQKADGTYREPGDDSPAFTKAIGLLRDLVDQETDEDVFEELNVTFHNLDISGLAPLRETLSREQEEKVFPQ